MNKTNKKTKIVLISIVLLLTSMFLLYLVDDVFFQLGITAHIMCPPENRQRPDFSGEITDVRVTTVERDFSYSLFFKWTIENTYPEPKPAFRQIYYGYCMDGKYYDFPYENFDLRALEFSRVGFEATDYDHCVQIGPYVLIGISHTPRFDGLDALTVINDTINSDVHNLLNYVSSDPSKGDVKGSNSVLMRENMFGRYELWRSASLYSFPEHYYVVVKMDELSEDYQLTCVRYVEYSAKEEYTYDDSDTTIYTLVGNDGIEREYRKAFSDTYTYDDIMDALNRE